MSGIYDRPAVEYSCRRCGANAGHDPEVCWYCSGPLCVECWDKYGHCGHSEADRANEAARAQDAHRKRSGQ